MKELAEDTPTRWPTAVDYQTAMQAPPLCFTSEELQEAEVRTSMLGLPLVATGNVAVVFRLDLPDGSDVALRCFTRRSSLDVMARRYDVLNAYFEKNNLSSLAPTKVYREEILVDGERYPVAVMPWLPGRQLHLFIEDHLDDPDMLVQVADRWRGLMRAMRAVTVAHGDLSDGNVLVDANGQIRLIDYDAAYVPPLDGDPPSEIGKPNYQHPERLSSSSPRYGYWGPDVDHFASLVVYLTLRAVAADSSLWDTYHMGDNLIFVQKDFEEPGETPIWPNLRSSKDIEVRKLTDVLERYCLASVSELPSLEAAIAGNAPAVPAAAKAARSAAKPKASGKGGSKEAKASKERTAKPRAPMPSNVRREAPPIIVAGENAPMPAERVPSSTRAIVVLILVALALTIAGALWYLQPWATTADASGPAPAATPSAQTPAPATAASASAAVVDRLPGFYTGYTTLPDGSREALGLRIEPVEPGSTPPRFRFSMNSLQYQMQGTGTFDPESGYVDLEGQYIFTVRTNADGQLVLSTGSPGDPSPLIQVTKTEG